MDFNGSVLLTCCILHQTAEVARFEPNRVQTVCKRSTYMSIIWGSAAASLLWPPKCYIWHFGTRC